MAKQKQLALAKISRPRLHDVLARTRLFGLLDKAARAASRTKPGRGAAQRCNGWAAGLTLLLARPRRQAALPAEDDPESLQHVFGYFAQCQQGEDAAIGEQALALYRGAFLAEEEGEPWPVAMRERLRGKFIHAVGEHAAKLEAAHRDEEAITWYLRGLDADNVVELFYQGLMRCYHRLDRLPEAVSAYRRLKQTLSVTLNLPRSAGTERLYRGLRLG